MLELVMDVRAATKSCANCYWNRSKLVENDYGRCHIPGEVCGKWSPLKRRQEPHSAKQLFRGEGKMPHLFSRDCCLTMDGMKCEPCGVRIDANEAREYAWGMMQ